MRIAQHPYDHAGPRDQLIFNELDEAAEALRNLVPFHYIVRVSRGVGNLPVGLWIAILDPEVTSTPTGGLYIVYLFTQDRRRLFLSLNQGVTSAGQRAHARDIAATRLLRSEAMGIRAVLGDTLSGLETDIDLGKGGLLPKYRAGNVVAKEYDLAIELGIDELVSDLQRFLGLYSAAVVQAEAALATGDGKISLPPRDIAFTPKPVTIRFEPKDDSDYRAHIGAQEQVKSRVHEGLVRRLGEWSRSRGFEPNTNVHPRDLVLHTANGPDVLVEVKVFPAGRPREAIRSAIGQLFEYRRFYPSPGTQLIAALSDYPGNAYRDLLESLDIGVVWPRQHGWHGSPKAQQLGLVS